MRSLILYNVTCYSTQLMRCVMISRLLCGCRIVHHSLINVLLELNCVTLNRKLCILSLLLGNLKFKAFASKLLHCDVTHSSINSQSSYMVQFMYRFCCKINLSDLLQIGLLPVVLAFRVNCGRCNKRVWGDKIRTIKRSLCACANSGG